MNITNIENEIINILGNTGIEVKGYPDVPENYTVVSDSAILVKYDGSTYSDPQSTGVVTQERTIKFNIMLFFKVSKNSKYQTVYDLVEDVRQLLLGYEPAQCSKLYMISDELVDYTQKMWVYSITVATKTVVFEGVKDEVLTKKITTVDNNGNVETEVESES